MRTNLEKTGRNRVKFDTLLKEGTMTLEKKRIAALRRDIRALNKLANEAARLKDTTAFVAATRARDERHATLVDLIKTSEPSSDVHRNVKELLTRMAWTGYWPAEEERKLLYTLGYISGKETLPPDAPISERERLETIAKFRDPEAIGFRVFYENPPEEKTILSKLAWFGVINEADRTELVRVGIIFDREKSLQLHDEAVRLKKVADTNDKEAVN